MFTKKELKYHLTYMNIAREMAKLSYAERKKVGAVLVKDYKILSTAFNGTPKGTNNVCEVLNTTKPDVIHA